MRERLDDFENANTQLIVVDPHDALPANYFMKDVGFETGDVGFPVLFDAAQTASAAYGVAFQMRIHTELSNRPATFLIDRDGVIRYARRGNSFSDRPSADDMLQELGKMK